MPSSHSLANSGARKKTPMANASETAIIMAMATPLSSSPSASMPTLAEKLSAFMPRVSVSASAMTPRTSGTLRTAPVKIGLRGCCRTATVPSGRRTATQTLRWPRIMTPSITAWPP